MKNRLSDEDLLEKYFLTKDNRFIDALFHRYKYKVENHCRMFANDTHESKDLQQDVFVKAYCNVKSFNGDARFSTWLFRLTRNLCIDHVRIKKRRIQTELVADHVSDIAFLDASNCDSVLLENKCEFVHKLLEEMPTSASSILSMKYLDGLTIYEIAQILNISESAVKMRLHRIRRQIRRKTKVKPWVDYSLILLD